MGPDRGGAEIATPCVHHWKLSSPYRDGDKRITHERCKFCGAERDLVEVLNRGTFATTGVISNAVIKTYYTEIQYPNGVCANQQAEEREVNMGKGGNTKGKKQANEARKGDIVAYFRQVKGEYGAIKKTAESFGLPKTTMRGLLTRWGELQPGAELPSGTGPTSDNHIPTSNISQKDIPPVDTSSKSLVNGQRMKAYYKSLESRLEEIKADIAAGMSNKAIREKYGFSKDAWSIFRRRHGLIRETLEQSIDYIQLVEKLLSMPQEEARHFWEGVKYAHGIGLGECIGTGV